MNGIYPEVNSLVSALQTSIFNTNRPSLNDQKRAINFFHIPYLNLTVNQKSKLFKTVEISYPIITDISKDNCAGNVGKFSQPHAKNSNTA